MTGKKSLLFLILYLHLLLVSLLAACAAPAATSQSPTTSVPAITTQAQITSAPTATTTAAPTTIAAAPKPQGELVASMNSFGNENWFPWLDPAASHLT